MYILNTFVLNLERYEKKKLLLRKRVKNMEICLRMVQKIYFSGKGVYDFPHQNVLHPSCKSPSAAPESLKKLTYFLPDHRRDANQYDLNRSDRKFRPHRIWKTLWLRR